MPFYLKNMQVALPLSEFVYSLYQVLNMVQQYLQVFLAISKILTTIATLIESRYV